MARERIFAAAALGFLAALFFTPNWAKAAAPESDETISAPSPNSTLLRARQLLRNGQTAVAERLIGSASLPAPDDALLCLSGEINFRRGRFAEASAAFTAALQANPENARAHWGLGRIDQLYFRGESARDHFARAFSLNPRDTEIILSFAEYVSDPASRATLLRNVAALARQEDPERADRAIAELKILERLQGRTPARLASPYTPYRLPLSGFRPAGASKSGVVLPVRINDGKILRLLVDTGARGILIDSRSAAKMGLETIVESSLRGFGGSGSTGSHVALARKVSIGNLAFDECVVEVSDHSLTAGADGVLGIDLFERFAIELNPAALSLNLTPSDSGVAASRDSIPALGLRNLLLVNTRMQGKDGLFLLDTGAAFTTVEKHLVPANLSRGGTVGLLGAQGSSATAVRVGRLEFQVGQRSMVDFEPLVMDLQQFGRIEGVEISGILGYSVLGQSSLKIDLRRGTVEFARAR